MFKHSLLPAWAPTALCLLLFGCASDHDGAPDAAPLVADASGAHVSTGARDGGSAGGGGASAGEEGAAGSAGGSDSTASGGAAGSHALERDGSIGDEPRDAPQAMAGAGGVAGQVGGSGGTSSDGTDAGTTTQTCDSDATCTTGCRRTCNDGQGTMGCVCGLTSPHRLTCTQCQAPPAPCPDSPNGKRCNSVEAASCLASQGASVNALCYCKNNYWNCPTIAACPQDPATAACTDKDTCSAGNHRICVCSRKRWFCEF